MFIWGSAVGAYTKIRNSVDSKIKQITENPEKLFKKIKLKIHIIYNSF